MQSCDPSLGKELFLNLHIGLCVCMSEGKGRRGEKQLLRVVSSGEGA